VSRIGKMPVSLPPGVTVRLEDGQVLVSGPKGQLSLDVNPALRVSLDEEARSLRVERSSNRKFHRAIHGTTRSLIANMVTGVTEGYQKVLEVHGVGYRARVEGGELILQVGYSHPVHLPVPEGLEVTAEQTRRTSEGFGAGGGRGAGSIIQVITVSGRDKQQVGEFAAQVRRVRRPEPYLGKGIRYRGEQVRRKEGKSFVSGGP